jgi:RNA polymerase sigma factor (sigma-70 family)
MSAVSGDKQNAVVAPGVKPPLAVPRRLLKMRSDATLAERFASGDELAFDVLYERHRPVVLAVSMGVLGTSQDAEDATQETFSALAVALRTKPPAEMRPWLIRVARNASIDTTRRRRHRLLTLDGEIPDIPARPTGAGQAELAMVLDGIRDLPEGQRMALLMRELGGHTYAEIAEFLETDEEAVKGLIARARVGLRTYREATELPCATARSTIAAEPDGRRYDKTIRRHLRTCPSCRSYRGALRSDAKTLRAALPLPAGGVATGGLSGGAFAAAKGAVLGYGITQAAATCAASVCAVGAVGGMVFIAPIHKLGVWPILPAQKSAPVHHKVAVSRPATTHAAATPVVATHAAVSETRHATVISKPAATHSRKAKLHVAARGHHSHRSTVTVVKLPSTFATHSSKPITPTRVQLPTQTVAQAPTPATVQAPTPVQAPAVTPTAQAPTQPVAQVPTPTVAQPPAQTVAQPPAQTTTTSHGYGSGQTSTTGTSTHSSTTSTITITTPTSPTSTTTTPSWTETAPDTTTTPTQTTGSSTFPGGWSHGGSRGRGWRQGTTTATTPTTTITVPTSTAASTTTVPYNPSTTTSSPTWTSPYEGGSYQGSSDDQQSSWNGSSSYGSYGHHR